MKTLILTIATILTVYQPVPSQTDSTPLITADGSVIDPLCIEKWCAVPEWMFEYVDFGDTVYIDCQCDLTGEYIIKDRMNKRYWFCDRIDVLISEDSPIGVWDAKIYF